MSNVKPPVQLFPCSWLTTAVIAVSFILCATIAALAVYPLWYKERIYPGVRIAGIPLGGLTYDDAAQQLQQAADAWARRGIRIEGFGATVVVSPFVSALDDPDLTYELVRYDVQAMAEEAWGVGRRAPGETRSSWLVQALTAIGARISPVELPARYHIDGDRLLAVVESEFGRYETPAQDARVSIDRAGRIEVRDERQGERIDTVRASTELAAMLERFSSGPLVLTLVEDFPRLTAPQARARIPDIAAALARAPFRVVLPAEVAAQVRKERGVGAARVIPSFLEITPEMVAQWIIVVPYQQGGARLAFAPEMVAPIFMPLREMVDQPAIDAKFAVQDGKVAEFQGSHDGRELDVDASITRMEEAFLIRGAPQAYLAVKELKAVIQTAAVNDLGIQELLGVGRSNFSGSPSNRRHNIGVGVAAVNGALIPPGEEFSLLKTLGDVDAAAGYLPELVIKGNRTVPEYGGGLCQIGTTVFRAALAAGMPITERRNHSYRVRYYEPAGIDATIYSPSPDFRFLNDTGAHLLFQARVEGDDAIFELWGTPDGRVATSTSPVVYNIVQPPPTKFIETTDLKPGEKRCTESAHSGADARFTYTVTYPDGTIREEEFKSHYRPWQAVCLIGVEKIKGAGEPSALPSPDATGVRGR